MSSICIIPARAGSKRIIKKNIKPFMGKPIMAYSIEAAINKVSGELVALKEEFERKNSEVWYRYKTLSAAQRSAKEYIENCYKQLAEVSASYYGCEDVAEELQR